MNNVEFYNNLMRSVREALADPNSPVNQWWEEYWKTNPVDWEKLCEEYKG
jgi:hypothetical protein